MGTCGTFAVNMWVRSFHRSDALLSVSGSRDSFLSPIRSGVRLPNPRHWESLSELIAATLKTS